MFILKLKKSVILITIIYVSLTQAVQAQSVGVFGLFSLKSNITQNKLINDLEEQTIPLGCALRREGSITEIQGNYDMSEVNRFFLLECESSILQNNESYSVITNIRRSTDNFSVLEGPISQFGNFGLAKPGNGNSYIFKLSDYNNISPRQRNKDSIRIVSLVEKRKDRFQIEAIIRLQNAYGMKRPDELEVIYYDSLESGERFRSNAKNDDVMELIGKFNKNHLIQTNYLIAQSNR